MANALKNIAIKHPTHLEDFLHDLEYLSKYGNTPDIQGRANEVLQALKKPIYR